MSADKAPLPTVLVVDDAPANLSLLAGLLNKSYRVKLAPSGAKALELANDMKAIRAELKKLTKAHNKHAANKANFEAAVIG